jgi:hypothetical protein
MRYAWFGSRDVPESRRHRRHCGARLVCSSGARQLSSQRLYITAKRVSTKRGELWLPRGMAARLDPLTHAELGPGGAPLVEVVERVAVRLVPLARLVPQQLRPLDECLGRQSRRLPRPPAYPRGGAPAGQRGGGGGAVALKPASNAEQGCIAI